ncbi:D-2-hydroxyacid dehydrogenase family protein [Acuticoccus kandeliae]|uniref:D-2-hydroxyacid dehydrogenase family protein n=1 Tax=Acuticoccus kandeliae TaxID=2073160 RepID=UPI000D3E10D1|nr:D-2-hydroxyacid dehydrogenase family protein [Acuticoccus kandeliae]
MKVAVLDDYSGWVRNYPGWRDLGDDFTVEFFADHIFDETRLAERLADFDVVVLERERTPFPGSLMRRLPKLRHIASTGPVNWSIDLATASELGIVVSCTRSRYDETPELTWGLILALARRISSEEHALRSGAWQTSIGTTLAGKTLGLIGLGNVGRRVAEFGNCFGMNVIAWSENLTAERARESGATLVTFDEILAQSDCLSVHVVLGDRTRNLIDRKAIGAMKPGAFFVNTSRAGIVDYDALTDALAAGTLGGAALDVFLVEPLPADSPLRNLPNLVMTPHIGYVTDEQYQVFYRDVVSNISNFARGGEVRRLVMS